MDPSLGPLAYSVALWAFWLALWGTPGRGCLAALPFVLVTPLALYLGFAFHARLSRSVLGIILESNRGEAGEFLSGLWLPAAAAHALLLGLAGLALTLMRRQPLPWARRWRSGTLIGAPVFVAVAAAAAPPHLEPNRYPTGVWAAAIQNVRTTAPFGVVLQAADAIEGQLEISRAGATLKNFRFGAAQTLAYPDRQVYVLVIGESARRDRWALNGYERPTSPRLASERGLVSFTDVVTVSPATRTSVPVILTRKPPEVAVARFEERSLVSAFREAGFATYWLSTQAAFGYFDVTYARYVREADHVRFFNLTGDWVRAPADGVMLAPIARILATQSEPRQLIVVHTLGSHINYRLRYPDAFDVYQPSIAAADPTRWHDADYRTKLNNAYDNSILYTDWFLSGVIGAVKASRRPLAAVLYVSDHGEDLYDGGCNLTAHGKPTVAALRVPMFFWRSPDYDRVFPGKVAMLQAHRSAPINTQAVFPLLLDAADIHFPGEDRTRSVLSESFVPPSKRMAFTLSGTVDFNRAHVNSECLLVE